MKTLPLIALGALAYSTAAAAQNSVPGQPLPGLDDFSLPSARPTPRDPTPEPTISAVRPEAPPTPLASPTPRAVRSPRPEATPTLAIRATPTPRPSETPSASVPRASATVVPVPVVIAPTPTPTQTPTPAPSAALVASSDQTVATERTWFDLDPETLAVLGVLVLVSLGGLGWWWRRRTRHEISDAYEHEIPIGAVAVAAPPPPPAAQSPIVPPAPAAPGARARLELELIPNRAGTDDAGALVDYLIVVRNTGAAAASGVRLDVRLLSIGAQHDALIAALFAAPIAAPITPPFELVAGGTVEFGGAAQHPRATLEVMTVAGKTLFVPMLAVNLRYDWAGGRGQTAQSYVVGIARGAEQKLQPFRLDGDPRLNGNVTALEYTAAAIS